MRAIVLAVFLIVTLATARASSDDFPPLEEAKPELLRAAIEKEAHPPKDAIAITGVTVPHHLLAADLIARGIWAAAGNRYDRILVLSPDHFRKSRLALATTRRGFNTALGRVASDIAAVERLLASDDVIEESNLFEHEHGITGVLPFIAAAFPGTPVVVGALSIATQQKDWDRIVEALKPILTPRTLVVQSTDFSHYLPPSVARARDQETLATIAIGDPEGVTRLHQSNHLDSKASLYVQMRLQHEVFGAASAVIANRTSFEYIPDDATSTSYVVLAFAPKPAELSRLVYDDQEIFHFGGDVMLGRWFTTPLLSEAGRAAVVEGVRSLTAGQRLIVNLEGVSTAEAPAGAPAERHVMIDGLAGPLLGGIRTVAASLANNHAYDLGPQGLEETARTLQARDIRPLRHMEFADMGAFRLLAMNFIGAADYKGYPVVARSDRKRGDGVFEEICRSDAKPPLIVFAHWGEEYRSEADAEEREIADRLAACGVSLIIGAHSHQPSARLEAAGGGRSLILHSLGNLLFDQRSPRGAGQLLELRVFRQGTFAARLIPVPNLFDLATEASGGQRATSFGSGLDR